MQASGEMRHCLPAFLLMLCILKIQIMGPQIYFAGYIDITSSFLFVLNLQQF